MVPLLPAYCDINKFLCVGGSNDPPFLSREPRTESMSWISSSRRSAGVNGTRSKA
jgi:hypothetical protein